MIAEFNHSPATVSLAPGTDINKRIRMFLGHYDLRVYLSDTAYIDVGRGSFEAAFRMHYVIPDFVGCVGRVGQFCEFAMPCKLFGGGEHHNELPINVTLSGVPAMVSTAAKYGLKNIRPKKQEPFEIGNACVISADAKVMSGAVIGDGVVVAANGLARGSLEPFSIYGGLPARKLGTRFDVETAERLASVRWWDFDLVYLGNHLDQLQELAIDTSARHIYRKPTPRFILKLINPETQAMQVQILGFLDGEVQKPLSEAPARVVEYVKQMAGPGPQYQWVANIWEG